MDAPFPLFVMCICSVSSRADSRVRAGTAYDTRTRSWALAFVWKLHAVVTLTKSSCSRHRPLQPSLYGLRSSHPLTIMPIAGPELLQQIPDLTVPRGFNPLTGRGHHQHARAVAWFHRSLCDLFRWKFVVVTAEQKVWRRGGCSQGVQPWLMKVSILARARW